VIASEASSPVSAVPAAGEILTAIISSLAGRLILVGLAVAFVVFLIPLSFTETDDSRVAERRGAFIDWGITIAAIFIGAGVFLVEDSLFGPGYGYGRYRYGISFFFFAIAGQRVYIRCKS
jgi:hypothetical protein